jgi:hypothetical protein
MGKSLEERLDVLEKQAQKQTDRLDTNTVILKQIYKKYILYNLLHAVELFFIFLLTLYNIFSV